MPSILIIGFFPYSSGKTVVACALARGLANQGLSIGGFKPRSGHSFWHQYEATYKGLEHGRLFCEDIVKLRRASRCQLPYEILNPVDALMSPINVEPFLEQEQLDNLYRVQRDTFSQLVCERYTVLRNRKPEHALCLNEKQISSGRTLVDENFLQRLKSSVNNIIPVNSLSEWNEVFQTWASMAVQTCYHEVINTHEWVVVEAFNDAVCPDPALRFNLVIGVTPGRAIFYNAQKFHQRLDTFSKIGKDPRILKSEDIIKYLKRERTVKIPPLSKRVLVDYERLNQKLEAIVNITMHELTSD